MKKDQNLSNEELYGFTKERQRMDRALIDVPPLLESIESLQDYLKVQEMRIEESWGMFAKEAHIVSFFDHQNGEKVLSEIKSINQKEGLEPIKIGDLTLSNFSQCPDCEKLYSWQDLNAYYRDPFVPEGFSLDVILREDTRVLCKVCETFFMPSLILETKVPSSEFQFLCRSQVIHAIERFMPRPVLTQVQKNLILEEKKVVAIRLDICLDDLSSDLSLLCNFLQYTPYQQTLMMLSGNYQDMLVYGGNFSS
ncbi:hypothetical protein MJH12_06550 [bacterium]|nr:hypothetical protein [bacterium]